MKPPRLTIELVPKTSWYKNLRSILTKADWNRVRKACYKNAEYRCQICGGKGTKWPVECHEVWEYEEVKGQKKTFKQKLTGLVALCPKCHMVKHIGYARSRGKLRQCILHMSAVNEMTEGQTERLIQKAFELYNQRSAVKWDVDVNSILK